MGSVACRKVTGGEKVRCQTFDLNSDFKFILRYSKSNYQSAVLDTFLQVSRKCYDTITGFKTLT